MFIEIDNLWVFCKQDTYFINRNNKTTNLKSI